MTHHYDIYDPYTEERLLHDCADAEGETVRIFRLVQERNSKTNQEDLARIMIVAEEARTAYFEYKNLLNLSSHAQTGYNRQHPFL